MKTNNDFSAHSAKGLGAVVAHAVVAHAIPADAPTRSLSQRGNQRNVTLGKATGRRALLGNGVTYYNVTLGSVTHYMRAAMMLLMMLLTTATAWAFKTETPTLYTISRNSHTFSISPGSKWDTTNAIWAANDGHALDNGITIAPDLDVSYQNTVLQITRETTFTFTVPNNLKIAITSVVFKDASGNEVSATSHSEPGTTYTVTLASGTSVDRFVLTYGYIGGSCGTSAKWALSKQNGQYTALTISGSGAMNSYEYETVDELWRTKAPWDWRDLKSVTIGNDITSIGQYAFIGCKQLASITIPTGVTSIGNRAFKDCTGLPSIEIPASVTSIGDAAFSGCTSLNTVFLYSVNPPTLGSDVFDGCTKLDAILVPTGTAETYKDANGWKAYASKILAIDGTCGNNVYYSYDSTSKTLNIFGTGAMTNYSIWNISDIPWYGYGTDITTVVIADGVTSIGDYAFFDCTSLASITIPASVTSIGSAAFSNCNGLASIEIPIRVTSIGSSAFASCASLTSVTIPASVTSIGSSAFSGCTRLTSIEIPASVTSIGNEAFSGCTRLTSIEIPASVTSIGNEAFSYCTSLASISVAAGNTKYDSRNNCNAIIETETNTLIAGCKNTVIPDGTDGVTSIGDYAFWGCTDLTTITIPASVTSIGAGAFERCTSLTSIEIPTSVTSMGAGAFTGCTSLTSFKIPASVTSIGNYAFGDCTSLESITIPDGVTGIGENAFYGCTSLTSIEIPASVTSFGSGAFLNCTSLSSVTIYAPELSEYGYGYRAFYNNADGRKIYVFKNCVETYKAKAEDMGANEDDIEAITGINLRDNDDNRSLIAAADGNASGALNVTLQGRTLYKDGDWNTLCLPFSVTVGSGVMAGATAMTLNGSESGFDASTGVLTLNFVGVTSGNTIAAGTPFIVKWQKPDGYVAYNPATPEAECSDIVSPVFEGVTVSNAATTQTFGNGSFKSTYQSITFTDKNPSILFLGAGNTLYYPESGAKIGAQRAYFDLGTAQARQFVLRFVEDPLTEGGNFDGEGTQNGIGLTEITDKAGAWYTLDGVRLDGKPTKRSAEGRLLPTGRKKGLYIHNGRKVVVP